jgi:hypothetical protein
MAASQQYIGGYSVSDNYAYHAHALENEWVMLNRMKSAEQRDAATVDLVNNVFKIDPPIDNAHILHCMLTTIVQLPSVDFLKIAARVFDLRQPMVVAKRQLYDVWCGFITRLLRLVVDVADDAPVTTSQSPCDMINGLTSRAASDGLLPGAIVAYNRDNIHQYPLHALVVLAKQRKVDVDRLDYIVAKLADLPDYHVDVAKKYDNLEGGYDGADAATLADAMKAFIARCVSMHDHIAAIEEDYMTAAKTISVAAAYISFLSENISTGK